MVWISIIVIASINLLLVLKGIISEPLINLSGIIIGALLLIWQIGRQFKNSLELQKRNAQDQLKLQIYQELAEAIRKGSDNINGTMSTFTTMISDISTRKKISTDLRIHLPINIDNEKINENQFQGSKGITSIMILIEKYEIIIPRFTEYNFHFGELSKQLWKIYFKFLTIISPYRNKRSDSIPEQTIIELKKLSADYMENCQYCPVKMK